MSALEIAKAEYLRIGIGRRADDSRGSDSAAEAIHQGLNGRISRLTDRDDDDARKRTQIVEVFADAQNAAFVTHVAVKCAINIRLSEGMRKNLARHLPHSLR